MRTIEDLTDFSLVEDTIADWVEAASVLPEIEDGSKTYWGGFDFERKRPYATLNIVTQSSTGKPWAERSTVGGNLQTILFAPFTWSVDINFYVDSYNDGDEEDGTAIRKTARHYAQRLQNRAFLEDNRNILDAENIAYAQLGQTITGLNIQDEDKYIQQASTEFRFNGIAQTKITDSDYFKTINDPTITLSGE
jgi:hypothetical protein